MLVLSVLLSMGSYCLGMPEAVRIELPNHLNLLVFEEHSIPIVSMELLVSAGSVRDPQDMEGLANLTANSVLLGTRFLSFDDLNNRVDFIGGNLYADCFKDSAMVGLQVLKKDLETGVGLFTEIVVHPSFPKSDVDGLKDDLVGALRTQEDQPLEVANKAFDKALFLDTPYAGPVDGTEKSVAAIGIEDISKFYNAYYRPNNSVLVIGGDITLEEIKTMMVPALSEWQAADVPEPSFQKEFAEGSVSVAIDKPVSQATIIIGCPAMDRASEDYYPFQVMNQILGSSDLSSRLMAEIRIKKGLAYGVESYLAARKQLGSFRVVIQTKAESAKEATELARQELERLQNEPVSEAELQGAKSFLIGNFPLRYSAQQDIARFLAQIEFYGLGSDYPERYPKLINAVTADDILRVAKKYLKPENVLVTVADLKKAQTK